MCVYVHASPCVWGLTRGCTACPAGSHLPSGQHHDSRVQSWRCVCLPVCVSLYVCKAEVRRYAAKVMEWYRIDLMVRFKYSSFQIDDLLHTLVHWCVWFICMCAYAREFLFIHIQYVDHAWVYCMLLSRRSVPGQHVWAQMLLSKGHRDMYVYYDRATVTHLKWFLQWGSLYCLVCVCVHVTWLHYGEWLLLHSRRGSREMAGCEV